MVVSAIRAFLKLEAAGGIILAAAAAAALVIANSPLHEFYAAFLRLPITVQAGSVGLSKSLLHWVDDGLMAIFFLLVGLEIKREAVEGELSSIDRAGLPVIAAIGGMAMPALVYVAVNRIIPGALPDALEGWAIPTATDIAFALGVLSLLGARAPLSLRIFLLALAIIDDLGAIVIIAVFYSDNLSPLALGLAAASIGLLVVLNRRGVRALAPFILVGLFLWVCVLKSGVHATLAGVAIGMAVPLGDHRDDPQSPLRRLEHALHPYVAYAILPLFAFANAGVPLGGLGLSTLLEPLPLAIALGLFVGKQAGVMGAVFLAVRLGLARLPEGASWIQMYGLSVLTGIGFTMSLFIGTLAFDEPSYAAPVRIGVLVGSIVSAAIGYAVLAASAPRPSPPDAS